MKLYSFPGSCALGANIVLEWIGQPYELQLLQKDDLASPAIRALNPNGQVPILVDDGWALNENAAILNYLADKFPAAKLGGEPTPRGRAEVNRWLAMINSDVHPAFKPLFSATGYLGDEAMIDKRKDAARRQLRTWFERLDKHLEGRDWLAGERSIALPAKADGPIRVVPGPQDDEFGDALGLFLDSEWKISGTRDRMGYRLEGSVIKHLHGHNIVSDGTVNGSIQVPGNGQPIVLMPDRGTTGGYPKIATVIGADIGRFAQIPAGRGFRFKAVSMKDAQAAARAMDALLHSLPSRLREPGGFDFNIEALQNANVAGAAVNAFDAGTWQPDNSSGHQP